MKNDRNVRQLEVIKKYENYLIWLLEKMNGFPKKHKYLLGERIGQTGFDILEKLLEIQYSSLDKKKNILPVFNFKLENLRQLMRITWKMKLISHENFLWQEVKIDEVGRMVHGLVYPSTNQ